MSKPRSSKPLCLQHPHANTCLQTLAMPGPQSAPQRSALCLGRGAELPYETRISLACVQEGCCGCIKFSAGSLEGVPRAPLQNFMLSYLATVDPMNHGPVHMLGALECRW